MKDKILKRARIIVGVVLIALIVGLFIIKPRMIFNSNEKEMKAAAERYFELNSNELPSGERVKTLKLQKLYDSGILKNDFYRPLSKKTCSNENSWVKVRRENGEYKYYVYLECGYLKSNVDHEGPVITLNGDAEMVINRDSKYKEPGVKSVVDKKDGTFKISDVTIKSDIDTSKTGTYNVTYTAFDKMSNKSEITRTVKVVRKIYNTVKTDLENDSNYKGAPDSNYVRLSNMLFRIYGYDKNKDVILVSEEDLANVNYTKIDDWLEYYYDTLNEKAKKMIVEKEYCSMVIDDKDLSKKTCDKKTKKRKVYIPSIAEINNASDEMFNFMEPSTISWIADRKNSKEAYATENMILADSNGKGFVVYNQKENYGIRPMLTIDGESLIIDGEGDFYDPYTFGDVPKAKRNTKINERYTGEYVSIDDSVFRIIETEKDGTTKVISLDSLNMDGFNESCATDVKKKPITYNPKDKSSIAYCINNQAPEYIDTDYFVKHQIKVPVYKKDIVYKTEIDNKKYEVLLSAPDMYEIFSAQSTIYGNRYSYWLKNTSQESKIIAGIQEMGVPYNQQYTDGYINLGIRVVGYLKKGIVISNGDGTIIDPYIIK